MLRWLANLRYAVRSGTHNQSAFALALVFDAAATLEDAERGHILRALDETDWIIGGPNGAAARLGMKRTTLQSKMQKLGISRSRG